MNDLDIEKLSETIVIAKTIAENIGLTPSYENLETMATKLNITIAEVMSFITFYKSISNQMMI